MEGSFFNLKETINCRGKLLNLSSPIIMGILNITADSFYAQSRCKNNTEILKRAETIVYEGGNIIDIGACSSRPGAVAISSEEEIGKLMPALNLIRKTFPAIPISVDTYRSDVAQKVIKEGEADIINDISVGEIDSKMFDVIAELNVPYILTHIKGNPQTMQYEPYYENVMSEIM
jgi:dihydropteroate synthase